MDTPPLDATSRAPPDEVRAGLGVPCHEAQADGVPCDALRDCAACDEAGRVVPASPPPLSR